MNRSQRRYGRLPRRNDSEGRFRTVKSRNGSELEEIYLPRVRRASPPMTSRCCYVAPDQQDFGQLIKSEEFPDQFQQLINDHYHAVDPVIPDTIKQLRELKKVLCGTWSRAKIESSCQYETESANSQSEIPEMLNHQPAIPELLSTAYPEVYSEQFFVPAYAETQDGSQWHNVENADDIDKFIIRDIGTQKSASTVTFQEILPGNIRISDVPRIKVIAEKFSMYKKNNIELRKLKEKIVCVEYDIFDDSSTGDMETPAQMMRVFFSVKPFEIINGERRNDETVITQMPSEVKRNFNIVDEDLKNLNEKEIEIIDGEIPENKSYLEDLRKVLKRNQTINANKNSINLITLYEMALKEYPPLHFGNSEDNLLSKAELKDLKDLIMRKCASSIHGICRKTIKPDKDNEHKVRVMSMISNSIVTELLRETGKSDVFQ